MQWQEEKKQNDNFRIQFPFMARKLGIHKKAASWGNESVCYRKNDISTSGARSYLDNSRTLFSNIARSPSAGFLGRYKQRNDGQLVIIYRQIRLGIVCKYLLPSPRVWHMFHSVARFPVVQANTSPVCSRANIALAVAADQSY